MYSICIIFTVYISFTQMFSMVKFGVYSNKCLTGVYEGVFLHVGFLVESLATVLAGIWPCVRVDQEVGGQSG